jgi:hypothetical protein
LPHLQSLRGTTQVIRALYKVHRLWELKELNLHNRVLLSKYFSLELTNLFLKNAQLERDCPKGDLCGLDFEPILGAQDFDDDLNFKLRGNAAASRPIRSTLQII